MSGKGGGRTLLALPLTAFLLLVPLTAAAHVTGTLRTFLERPGAAVAELKTEAAALEAGIADAEARAAEATARYRAAQERAAETVRFHAAVGPALPLMALFGKADVVELLADLRVLHRMVERDLSALDAFEAAHAEALRAREELAAKRRALDARLRLAEAFREALADREAFQASYPNPFAASLALAATWSAQLPLALQLLEHVRAVLADGAGLFTPEESAGGGGGWIATARAFERALEPLPPPLAARLRGIEVVLLPDHAYWIVRQGDGAAKGPSTIIVSRFEPYDRGHLRLTLERVLFRGFPVPTDLLERLNAERPVLLGIGSLDGADPGLVAHEEGQLRLPARR